MTKVLCALLLIASPIRIVKPAEPAALALTNVTVIDATGAPAKPKVTVVIVRDRITQIGPSESLRLSQHWRVVNARGKFLIPGLCDMHTHLTFATEKALPALIAHGVTCARDLGGDLQQLDQWRDEIARGVRVGPRIFRAGPYVDGPKDGIPADRAAATLTVKTPDEARRAVSTLKGRGVDLIKIHNALPRDAFFALMEEARAERLPVVVHLPRTGIRSEEASDAGVRSLEHTENLIESVAFADPLRKKGDLDAFNEFTDEKAAEVFARFARNGTFYTPALIAYREAIRMREKTNPASAAARKQIFPRFRQLVGLMQRAGVRLLAASDFAWPDLTIRPGVSLHDELELLVEAGLTPMQALQAATINPARSMDMANQVGTIEQGKRADLVLLDADPLMKITNTRKIHAVVIGGKLIEKTALEGIRSK